MDRRLTDERLALYYSRLRGPRKGFVGRLHDAESDIASHVSADDLDALKRKAVRALCKALEADYEGSHEYEAIDEDADAPDDSDR